tara:strand:+ start:28 stop:693 length:666 start_codon:yes stop_codon:yes gene_type:complete
MKIKKKILKNIFIQHILGLIVAVYIFIVRITSSIHFENKSVPDTFLLNNKPFILAFWHNQLMMISFCWKSKKKINILASSHSDGRFGSIIGKYFKLKNIPISSKDNNFILRSIINILNTKQYIGITPDGPRGPKEIVSEGIIKIARASKTPIIPCGFWSSRNIQLKSWDAFLVTLPFSKCFFVWHDPIYIPKNLKDIEIAEYQNLLKKMIDESINKAKNKI